MNRLLEALLALQAQDDVVDALRERLDALEPRLAELDQVRQRAVKSLEETRAGTESDERRQRELEGRISDHRQRHEKNVANLDAVKRMREATAAMLQVEAGRKLLMEEENELRALVSRVSDGQRPRAPPSRKERARSRDLRAPASGPSAKDPVTARARRSAPRARLRSVRQGSRPSRARG